MTALPRNPVDLPVKQLQSHNAATGRSHPNRSQVPAGADGEGKAPVSFSALVGKTARPEGSARPDHSGVQAGPAELGELVVGQVDPLNVEVSAHLDQIGLEQSILPPATTKTANPAVLNDQDLQIGVTSGTLPGQATGELQSVQGSGEVVLPGKPAPGAKSEPNGARATVLDLQNTQVPAEKRITLGTDGHPAQKPAATSDGLVLPNQTTIEQATTARADLSAARPDTGAPERRRPEPSIPPLPPRAAPSTPLQPEAAVRALAPQAQPVPVPVDALAVPVQQLDPGNVGQAALAQVAADTSSGADDLPRLQDVRVLGTRVIELAPTASERTGQSATVKVIDLQLQPDTLGRISAQLKRTGEGLEIRLEPSVAETALMLKEDRLALQRILGSLGTGSEPTIVRIVEPVTEQKQADGQDALTDNELGQAAQDGEWSNAFDDLYDGRRVGGEYQDVQLDDVENAGSGGARRTGDIYI